MSRYRAAFVLWISTGLGVACAVSGGRGGHVRGHGPDPQKRSCPLHHVFRVSGLKRRLVSLLAARGWKERVHASAVVPRRRSSRAIIGPYEITSQIGVGGMGEVYLARDTKLKREVEVKVLPSVLASDRIDSLASDVRRQPGLSSLWKSKE